MNEQDFNEHRIPTGGWQFRQPELNWTVPTPIANTLTQTTNLVIAVRKKNPALTAKHQWATNFEAVKAEVLRFNRKRLGLSEVAVPPPFLENHRSFGSVGARPVANAMAGLKRAARNTAVPIEWFKQGGMPVSPELANKRAAICVVCPRHEKGEWFTIAAGELIKKTIELRSDLKLETDYDAQLQSCGVCGCLLRAKLHTPLDVIVKKSRPEELAQFPATCWIAKRDA